MQCPKCRYEPTLVEMQQSPEDCVKCGVNYQGHARHVEQANAQRASEQRANSARAASAVVRDAADKHPGAQPVVVVDIRMGFWSMVVFMVKWVVASIPAAIILAVLLIFIGGAAYTLLTGVTSYLSYKERFEASKAAVQSEADRQINVPGSAGIKYFESGISQSENFAVMTVRAVDDSGVEAYSRIAVECNSSLAVATPQLTNLKTLNSYVMPTDYKPIVAGTPRQHIAIRACAGMANIHPLLR